MTSGRTRSIGGIYAYKRMPGYTLLEYVCENNREYAADGFQKSTLGKK